MLIRVIEQANGCIAAVTEKPSHDVCAMAVIHSKRLDISTRSLSGLWLMADGTEIVLRGNKRVIVFECKAKLAHQLNTSIT
jgi:hypothetical protein